MLKQNDGAYERQNTVQTQNLIYENSSGDAKPTGPSFGPCVFDERHNLFSMAGNIFILGLVVLLNEILDLLAAQSLEFVLEPCTPKQNIQSELLAAEIASDEAAVDVSGVIGF